VRVAAAVGLEQVLDLADVACGRYDAFWELKLNPWDMAAGYLLVREAGGVVTTVDGDQPLIDCGGWLVFLPVTKQEVPT